MGITMEMIDKAEGLELNRLIAELLGWKNIETIDKQMTGYSPKSIGKTFIPNWSENFYQIEQEIFDRNCEYHLEANKEISESWVINEKISGSSIYYGGKGKNSTTALARAFALMLIEGEDNEN